MRGMIESLCKESSSVTRMEVKRQRSRIKTTTQKSKLSLCASAYLPLEEVSHGWNS